MSVTKKLSETAILVHVSTMGIGNTRKDQEMTDAMCSQYGIASGNASASKKIWGDWTSPISTVYAKINKLVDEKTKPWGKAPSTLPQNNTGKTKKKTTYWRLCPLVDPTNPKRLLFKELEDDLRKLFAEADREIANFLSNVRSGNVESERRQSLGASFKSDDYLDADALAEKFGVMYEVQPVPGDDFRCSMSEEIQESIRQQVIQQERDYMAGVSLEVLNDAREIAQTLLEILGNESKAVKEDAVKKLQTQMEHCRMFPVTEETEVVLNSIDGAIRSFSAAAIAGNPAVKGFVKGKLKDVVDPPAPVVEKPKKNGKGKKSVSLGDVPIDQPIAVSYDDQLAAELAALEKEVEGL